MPTQTTPVRPGKWTAVTIRALQGGTKRFSQLQRELEGPSAKVLAATLRELERNGFLSRQPYATIPPRVDYTLTDLGRELSGVIAGIDRFVTDNSGRISGSRRAFDARSGKDAPSL